MTDQEINEAVARKLGAQWVVKSNERKNKLYSEPKDYCRSIAAAWEIVDFMKTRERYMELWSPMGDRHWVCSMTEKGQIIASGASATAPMAICLAFLKLP